VFATPDFPLASSIYFGGGRGHFQRKNRQIHEREGKHVQSAPLPGTLSAMPTTYRNLGFRAALFDLDGTLVRTFIDFPGMRRAMQALSERYGTAGATRDESDTLEIVRKMAAALDGAAAVAARREAYSLLEAMEREGCAHPEPIPGAVELLRCLQEERIAVGVITRNCRAVAEDLLERMALEPEVLVAREDTDEFKPHPEPVLLACRRLAVPPADAIMVGDLWTDIAAGKSAGVAHTIGIQWAYDPPERFLRCPPDRITASLEETALYLWAKSS
jgi:phosphoglycolate phosphatase